MEKHSAGSFTQQMIRQVTWDCVFHHISSDLHFYVDFLSVALQFPVGVKMTSVAFRVIESTNDMLFRLLKDMI